MLVLQYTAELIRDKRCSRRPQLSRTIVNGGITFQMQMRSDLAHIHVVHRVPLNRHTTLIVKFQRFIKKCWRLSKI